jgi:hypothetical protein
MPSFCRHGRFEDQCMICGKKTRRESRPAASPSARAARAPRAPGSGSGKRTRPGVVVRRIAREEEDGYENDLVPGLRATADAARLADELAFAVARLDELGSDPPGLYAEAALADDREEALWLVAQIAILSPLEEEDPWATISAARTTWASGDLPQPGDGPLGPRAGIDPRRGSDVTFSAYRSWAERNGGQGPAIDGEAAWTAQRRFDRGFERLSLPGLGRAARFELLLLVGRLGLAEIEPWTLMPSADAADETVLAAKRVFGIGDAVIISRRANELCHAVDVPVGALDLALRNWGRPPAEGRLRAASTVSPDDAVRARVAGVLGALPAPPSEDVPAPSDVDI